MERSRELDLLVVGSAAAGSFGARSVGSFTEMVAQLAHCSVVIVRSASPLDRVLPSQVDAIRELSATMKRPEGDGNQSDA